MSPVFFIYTNKDKRKSIEIKYRFLFNKRVNTENNSFEKDGVLQKKMKIKKVSFFIK